jgi:hypothetical protein
VRAEHVTSAREALNRVDDLRTGRERNAAAVLARLDALASTFEEGAAGAPSQDAARMRALGATLRARAASLR